MYLNRSSIWKQKSFDERGIIICGIVDISRGNYLSQTYKHIPATETNFQWKWYCGNLDFRAYILRLIKSDHLYGKMHISINRMRRVNGQTDSTKRVWSIKYYKQNIVRRAIFVVRQTKYWKSLPWKKMIFEQNIIIPIFNHKCEVSIRFFINQVTKFCISGTCE